MRAIKFSESNVPQGRRSIHMGIKRKFCPQPPLQMLVGTGTAFAFPSRPVTGHSYRHWLALQAGLDLHRSHSIPVAPPWPGGGMSRTAACWWVEVLAACAGQQLVWVHRSTPRPSMPLPDCQGRAGNYYK